MPDDPEEESKPRGMAASVWLLEHAQDLASIVVGGVLIVLAGTELVSGIVDFVSGVRRLGFDQAGTNLLDRVLLVLILVEIVHTVVLSLRAHHLVAQPFIVVGLVAVIRRILVVLSGTGTVYRFKTIRMMSDLGFVSSVNAARWYSLITPPSTLRRWTGRSSGGLAWPS